MSSYLGFSVNYETSAGVIASVGAGVSVKVRADGAGSDASESPLTTDSNGAIAAGSLAAIPAGTKVHFRVENYGGMAFSVSQITT
ncbi:MAG: hypothetical protein ABI539_07075 [Acidobacteriota bacterium]